MFGVRTISFSVGKGMVFVCTILVTVLGLVMRALLAWIRTGVREYLRFAMFRVARLVLCDGMTLMLGCMMM